MKPAVSRISGNEVEESDTISQCACNRKRDIFPIMIFGTFPISDKKNCILRISIGNSFENKFSYSVEYFRVI